MADSIEYEGNILTEKKGKDHEYSMARSQLDTAIKAAKRLKGEFKGEGQIRAWVQSKISKASDYLDAAADYIESGEHDLKEELLLEKNVPTNPSLWSRAKVSSKKEV